ncbi:hypothetical protein [Thermomonas sp.]|uniref:hypothetical protein n=1 Tax=Thermomonas sp. TaxID=1971895 RepID=UPI0025CC5F80|nr:hypothetical protein [Thermomonas sp.]
MLRGSRAARFQLRPRCAQCTVDARHPGLIQRFGGHAMAAGLGTARADLPAFREAFVQVAREVADDRHADRYTPCTATARWKRAISASNRDRPARRRPLRTGLSTTVRWRIRRARLAHRRRKRHLKLELGLHGKLPERHPLRRRLGWRRTADHACASPIASPDDYRGSDASVLVVHQEAVGSPLPA